MLRLLPHDVVLLHLHYLEARLSRQLVRCQDYQVLRLTIFKEVDVSELFIFFISDFMADQLVDVLTMVVAKDTEALFASDDESFFLKLISVAETNETPLGKVEEIDLR